MLMVSALCLSSCGGDDANDSGGDSPTPSGITITLRSQTISEGAEVDAATTTVLTLNYNNTVKVTGTGITLNGVNVTAKSNPVTAMSVDVPLALEDGTEYTLNVSKGAIVATADPSVSAPELTIHFKTRAKEQPVNPDIPTTPVTASTEEAKQLYSFLLEQYGVKTISSVMANVNWNNECAEKVYQLTGKYPAMNCYDFIHILYSPANWIDYTTIKPVQDWVNAGGLVQLMWHFNVPKFEGSTDATCTPSETTFNTANALVSGTWENKWFYEQMDKVVATLLKLQDAGIAATWRPFHEAAGNATAKQQAYWTKAWFWWGYDGAETYKKHALVQ